MKVLTDSSSRVSAHPSAHESDATLAIPAPAGFPFRQQLRCSMVTASCHRLLSIPLQSSVSSLIMADSSSGPSGPSSAEASDFRPSDGWWNRTVNFTRMLTGQMSPAGQKKYWADSDDRYSELDCKRCEKDRDYLLKYSPIIRFMNDNIQKLGGEMGPQNIHCRTCRGDEEAMQGGFDHKYGIKICANWVQERSQLEDVITHEMVHAYDHLRFKTNLTEDDSLRHAACSEVICTRLPMITSH